MMLSHYHISLFQVLIFFDHGNPMLHINIRLPKKMIKLIPHHARNVVGMSNGIPPMKNVSIKHKGGKAHSILHQYPKNVKNLLDFLLHISALLGLGSLQKMEDPSS